jgi:hypothetical protein
LREKNEKKGSRIVPGTPEFFQIFFKFSSNFFQIFFVGMSEAKLLALDDRSAGNRSYPLLSVATASSVQHSPSSPPLVAKPVAKSSSTSALTFSVNQELAKSSVVPSPIISCTSSRDVSPSREMSPLLSTLNPPIILCKGPRGFGFTLAALPVYIGDSNVFILHHIVHSVDLRGPAFEAGYVLTDRG